MRQCVNDLLPFASSVFKLRKGPNKTMILGLMGINKSSNKIKDVDYLLHQSVKISSQNTMKSTSNFADVYNFGLSKLFTNGW